ncbi:MAG: endopeptidase La [Actinomycetota bacterium]|nr:endopeptidase La [Actinomycetota bacterium]
MVQAEVRQDRSSERPIPAVLPVLPLRETVVFPKTVVPLLVGKPGSKRLIEDLADVDGPLLTLVTMREDVEEPGPGELFGVGTVARAVQVLRFPDGSFRVVVEGVQRVRMDTYTQLAPYLLAEVEPLEELVENGPQMEALQRQVRSSFDTMIGLAPQVPDQLLMVMANIDEPSHLADFVASSMTLDVETRQDLLETLDVEERMRKLLPVMAQELEILQVGSRIQEQVEAEVGKGQREFLLRKQMEAIRRELGEGDEGQAEVNELRSRLEEAGLSDEARKEAFRELGRLEKLPAASPEYHVIRTYLDWMIRFPWQQLTQDHLEVTKARRVLDEDHYDLEKVKDRIVEYLAVRKLKNDMRGPILCLVGPPGVGKTSLGRSVARALGREFVRLSLGGVRDESEIRGHRRTYIGALPGRIVQSLARAGTRNPVLMLDEVDKLGADFRGDPAAALLEVLDPEQNWSFRDHYLDVPVDLSQVLFITTANVVHTIPPALLDRMEVLEIPGYTVQDKLHIARRFLVPKQIAEHGLGEDQVSFDEEALRLLIGSYTREAGVRNLDRQVATICRKVAARIVEGSSDHTTVTPELARDLLGPERFRQKVAEEQDEVGVATGLAVTPTGGEVLFVEVALVPGNGKVTITGQLGDVMKESAQAAVTYARSRVESWGLEPNWLEKTDVHIHVPEGAVPKDGPSAGVTMTTALHSALVRRPVQKSVGMTGEVTLRGKVLPIGGVKEKVLAAHLAGLETVLLPADNQKDLPDIPELVRKQLDIRLVSHMDEVLEAALEPLSRELGQTA